MHPSWPRGNGNEILKPLKRDDTQSENTMRVPLRQITTAMLITIIERKCNQPLENLKKMRRQELEAMAEAMLTRNYITIDLGRP
jgi:formate dehydrogenase maturation protein FdhE